MPSAVTVEIRGKKHRVVGGSKADIARALLDAGYSVSEISKAVPMAYSQVHSIHQKIKGQKIEFVTKELKSGKKQLAVRRTLEDHAQAIPTARQRDRARKPLPSPVLSQPKPRKGIGKLRTPGHPSDIDVGPCGNCNHDLVVRRGPTGYLLVHVNTTAEEYLAVTQFCQPVPEVLLG